MSSRRRQQRSQAEPISSEANARQVQKILLALLGLGVGHVLLYLSLTGDARSALKQISASYTPAQLEAAKRPGPMPEPGTDAYSPWLRGYEQHAAASDHSLHARHEGLMRYGMLASFLIAATILGAAMQRYKREQARAQPSARRTRTAVRKPVRAAVARAPVRPAQPVRAAVAPVRVMPEPVQPVRAAVAPRVVEGEAVTPIPVAPIRVAPVLTHPRQKRYRRSA